MGGRPENPVQYECTLFSADSIEPQWVAKGIQIPIFPFCSSHSGRLVTNSKIKTPKPNNSSISQDCYLKRPHTQDQRLTTSFVEINNFQLMSEGQNVLSLEILFDLF